MILKKFVLPAVLALGLLAGQPALAAEDPAFFLLTPALMQKLKAAEGDMQAIYKDQPEEAKDDGSDQSIGSTIRKIDSDPKTTAVLAKHGLTSRELVLSGHALLHAGMFVSQEASTDAARNSDRFRSFTKEQQANIALVRAMTKPR